MVPTTNTWWGLGLQQTKHAQRVRQELRGYVWVIWGYIGIMENKMETTIVHWGYIGIMKKKRETTMMGCIRVRSMGGERRPLSYIQIQRHIELYRFLLRAMSSAGMDECHQDTGLLKLLYWGNPIIYYISIPIMVTQFKFLNSNPGYVLCEPCIKQCPRCALTCTAAHPILVHAGHANIMMAIKDHIVSLSWPTNPSSLDLGRCLQTLRRN